MAQKVGDIHDSDEDGYRQVNIVVSEDFIEKYSKLAKFEDEPRSGLMGAWLEHLSANNSTKLSNAMEEAMEDAKDFPDER